jgi:hypothetical protein
MLRDQRIDLGNQRLRLNFELIRIERRAQLTACRMRLPQALQQSPFLD